MERDLFIVLFKTGKKIFHSVSVHLPHRSIIIYRKYRTESRNHPHVDSAEGPSDGGGSQVRKFASLAVQVLGNVEVIS
jgi:hypothetical protein